MYERRIRPPLLGQAPAQTEGAEVSIQKQSRFLSNERSYKGHDHALRCRFPEGLWGDALRTAFLQNLQENPQQQQTVALL